MFQEGNFVISESKAIAAYIAAKYDKSGRLYPKDPEIRGAVDHRIHFHDSAFNDRLRAVLVSCVWPPQKIPFEPPPKIQKPCIGGRMPEQMHLNNNFWTKHQNKILLPQKAF